MTILFSDFISGLFNNPALLITVILTFGVVLVNGWTDAPNAIASCVATRSIGVRPAIAMAAVFNFLGVLIMTMLSATVAQTIYKMVDFGDETRPALVALCAAMTAIVIWAVAAWYFGIPTSESHALIAGLSGAAIAINGGLSGINGSEWIKVIYGLILSTGMGFVLGYTVSKLIGILFKNVMRAKANSAFSKAQVAGGAAMAFMHGAQDGQKFMGVFMLGIFLAKGVQSTESFQIPIWLMLICSAVMGIGTSIGGMKIIKSVGMDMVKLDKHEGFAADLTAFISLLVSTIFGLPVSTTHTKTTAIMGVGAAKRISNVRWSVVKEMFLAWILTFPGCGFIGFIMAKLFLYIF